MRRVFITLCAALLLAGCASGPDADVMSGANQETIRGYQSRVYDIDNEELMLRAIIATFQDLGFSIDQADEQLGVITGTKMSPYRIRLTVVARPAGAGQLKVRASAHHDVQPMQDPAAYRNFFLSLDKALFMASDNVK